MIEPDGFVESVDRMLLAGLNEQVDLHNDWR